MPSDRSAIEGRLDVVAREATLSATAEVVRLNQELERAELSVSDQIRLQDARLRQWVAFGFVGAFVAGDLPALTAFAWLGWLDQTNIEHKLIAPGDRIINQQVIIALLGGTTIRVGTIAVIIARYLFPGRPRAKVASNG